MLKLEHVSAAYGQSPVLFDIDLEVRDAEAVALIGRNGVGKTSTIKAILGLIDRSGTVTLEGERIDGMDTHRIVQRGVGYVPEDREVFSMLSVEENLRLAERDGSPRREMVAELFPDLVERRAQRAGTLSGGQQQMVSLARALINENRLLMVDEPTKGLAPRIVAEVTAALEVAARSVPVLLVEQNVPVIRRLAGRIIVIEGGRVVHTGDASLLDDESELHRFLGVHTSREGERA